MRLALILAVLGLASPAQAHCFSIWHFNYPQNCGVRLASNGRQPQPAPAQAEREATPAPVPDDRSWYVEIVLPDADPARARALEALRPMLSERTAQ